MFVLSWFVLELTHSSFRVVMVGFSGMLPMFLLGLVGGYLADRANRRTVLLATQMAGLFPALIMASLLAAGSERYWYAYPLALVTGTAWALDMPSRRSSVYDLLGRAGLTNGLALDTVGMSISRMLGPPLGGLLIALTGFWGPFAAATAFHLAAVALVLRLRIPRVTLRKADSNILRDVTEGLRFVAGHRTLLATALITLVMNLLLFPYVTLVPVIASEVLHVEALLAGVLQGASGFGALAGAIVVASIVDIKYHGRLYVVGAVLSLLALLLFALSQWYVLSLPTLIVLGLGTSGFSTMQATLVILLAGQEMRGKALGVISLAIGAGPIGALFIAATRALSPGFALGLNAVLGITLIALIVALIPSILRQTALVTTRP